MSEFSININPVSGQSGRLLEVAGAVKHCKNLVESLNHGLGAIGIGDVGPSLNSISARLDKQHHVCDNLAISLQQIILKYKMAEAAIKMGFPSFTDLLANLKDLLLGAGHEDGSAEEVTYVGAFYLVNNEGAASQGHAAIMLLRSDGSVEYYSYGMDVGHPGRIVANVIAGNGSGFMDTEFLDGDKYSNYIFMPISNEAGVAMHDEGQYLVAHPGDYNLLTNNCNMNAQRILEAGGMDFAPDEFDMVATRPNTVYENMMEIVQGDPDKYQGYIFGNIDQSDLSAFVQNDVGNFVSSDGLKSDYNFTDSGQWLEDILNGYADHVNMTPDQFMYEWQHHPIDMVQDVLDYAVDGAQGYVDTAIDGAQGYVNTAADALQSSVNTYTDYNQGIVNHGIDYLQQHIDNNHVNAYIEHLQATGNAWYDGVQTVGNCVYDNVQAVGNGIVDGAQTVGGYIVDGAQTVGGYIVDGAQTVGGYIVDGAQTVGGYIVDGAQAVGNGIVDGAQTVGGYIVDGVSSAVDGLQSVGDDISNFFGGMFN